MSRFIMVSIVVAGVLYGRESGKYNSDMAVRL